MKKENCEHFCSGNCRRVGCNCECGEWHIHSANIRVSGKKGSSTIGLILLMIVMVVTIYALIEVFFNNGVAYVRAMETPTRTIPAVITAYSEIDSCHYENCAMASGRRAYVGAIACPREVKLYTRVIIDNIPYICEDRTNISLNGRFDIFIGYGKKSYDEAIAYGKKERVVQIVREEL